jgi:NAD(P)-dependent dehydrogenase (short-subunit alcohol dehydrogenase family)
MSGMELRDRVVLVTGSSSGIGRATAVRLAADGARLVVHGTESGRVHEVAALVGGHPVVLDLSTPGGPQTLAAQAEAVFGGVDVLVSSAGMGWSGAFTDMSPEEIQRVLQVDLAAPIELTRALLPGMVQRGRGHLCFVGSIAGRTGVAGESVYAAAKAGLDGFVESLRMELVGSGIETSIVVPGAVDTAFFERRGRRYDRRVPRQLRPEAVADAVAATLVHPRDEVYLPRWLRAAVVVRAVAPRGYRRLTARFGETQRIVGQGGRRPG